MMISFSYCLSYEKIAQLGTFIGAIASLLALILLYRTLIAQKNTLKEQKRAFEIESFESKFFNLLKVQREIADELRTYFTFLDEDLKENRKTIVGRVVFIYAISELTNLWKSINTNEYLGKSDEDSLRNLQREIDELDDPDKFDHSQPPWHIKESKNGVIEMEKLRSINKEYNLTEDDWKSIQNKGNREKIIFLSSCFFTKCSYAFGHYYRHLFLIFNFVDQFKDKEKRKIYINFIEAQMSPLELALLFYYSASNPEILRLLKKYNFLEHLTDRDLIDPSHRKVQF